MVVIVSFLLEVTIECLWSKFYCTNFNSFIVDLFYLENSSVKSSLGFLRVWFSWVIISCILYISALLTLKARKCVENTRAV